MLDGADHLAHGQHHAAQFDQVLAQLEGAPLQAATWTAVGEQLVLEPFDGIVERLDGLEVPVDHDIEQRVDQRADAVPLPAEVVEAARHLADVELGGLTVVARQSDGDQAPRQDEGRDAMFDQQ